MQTFKKQGKLELDPELKSELELVSSIKGDYEVWTGGELELWQKCLLLAGVDARQRRSLASGQKMKPPIFPARRNLIPPSSSSTEINLQHWGELVVVIFCLLSCFAFSGRRSMIQKM